MTKRFSFSRFAMIFVLMFGFVFTLAACGDSKSTAEKLEEVKSALTIQSAEALTDVTANLTFPNSGEYSAVVTWSSDNTAVIANDGTVNRPTAAQGDATVTITATIIIGSENVTKTFTVTVKALPVDNVALANEAKAALEAAHATTFVGLVDNVTLPTTGLNGATITWASSNADVLSNTGVVVRPLFGEGDQTIILTATITVGTANVQADFIATVLQLTTKTDAQVVTEAHTALGFGTSEFENVVANFALAKSNPNGTVITWVSDTPSVIEIVVATNGDITATIHRPEVGSPDQAVKLTATLTFGDATMTKEFTFTVLANIETPAAESIRDFIDNVELAVPTGLNGVTIMGRMGNGLVVTDGTDSMFIFTNSAPREELTVGTVINVQGQKDNRFGSPQLIGGEANALDIKVVADGVPATQTPVAKTLSEVIADMNSIKPDPYPVSSIPQWMEYRLYTVTAKVLVEGTGSYNTFLVPNDFTGTLKTGTSTYSTSDVLMIYYHSNINALRALDGQEITLNISMNGYRTDFQVWAFNFLGETSDIEFTLTDEAKLDATEALIEVPAAFVNSATFNLPLSFVDYQTNVEWTSNNTDVISIDAAGLATVTKPETGNVDVTLTAVLTTGSLERTLTYTVKVGDPDLSTIADVKALPAESIVRVEGVVTTFMTSTTAANGKNVFFQDETGGIYGYRVANSFEDIVVGNKVVVQGTTALFNGLVQLTSVTAVELVEASTLPQAVVLEDFTSTGLLPHQSKLVSVTDMFVTAIQTPSSATNGYNITLRNASGATIPFRVESEANLTKPVRDSIRAVADALVVGQYVDVVAAPLSWFNGAQIIITDPAQIVPGVVMNDEAKAQLVANTLPFENGQEVTSNLSLPTTGLLGATLAWSSSNTEVISNTGAVTRPELGADDVEVTLSYTVTVGEAVVEGSVVLTVLAQTPAVVYVETFDTMSTEFLGSTSYASGMLVGVNGITWTYQGTRGSIDTIYQIDGNGIMFGNPVDHTGGVSKLTATIQGGIGSFSIDLKRAFTGTTTERSLELLINGTSVGTFSLELSHTDVQVWTINDINVSGEFTFELRQTTPGTSRGQMTLDNLSWSAYE